MTGPIQNEPEALLTKEVETTNKQKEVKTSEDWACSISRIILPELYLNQIKEVEKKSECGTIN